MTCNHVMVDLETLGTGSNAAIASIGAVFFDPETDLLGETFHQRVQFSPSMGQIEPGTVKWWLQQSKEAQEALLSGERFPLKQVLSNFNFFLGGGVEGFWSNGPTFDERLLNEAFARFDSRMNYKFQTSRCMRTYRWLADLFGLDCSSVTREGIHHDALADAIYQARVIQFIHRRLPCK